MIKIIKTLVLVLLTLSSLNTFSQKPKWEKASFQVLGNCEMCQKKIETAAKANEGVKTARWNIVSQKMKVKFNPEVISIDTIQKSIANVGYDTEKYRADDEVYNNLHHCCHYEREK